MKLKCVDGIVREFIIARSDGAYMPDGTRHEGYSPAFCKCCEYDFGVHDTKVIKHKFVQHVCIQEVEAKK